ncbi:MAG: DNA repair protein RecN [Oscillospiraceae bacterium]|nr:DNA repair protein RecN [Oscillospiraceae bacterium]
MLKELYIENLAIIEKAVITFEGSFSAFTGETGAGKSILIGGINAVLGERVSKDIVRAGADKAVVTALFQSGERELLLTREIGASGNSIARIDGRTTTASELKEVAVGLIDVHGQHQTRLITSADVQLALIDSFGNISKVEYTEAFRAFSEVSKRLKSQTQANAFREEKIEILTSKIADLEPYKLKRGEEDEVSAQLDRLRNVQHISDTLNRAYSALASDSGEEFGAVDLLNICKISMGEAAKYVPECAALHERLAELAIEAADIKSEIAPLLTEKAHAEKLPLYEERMSDFLRLRRKYNVSDIDELVEALDEWREELSALHNSDVNLQKLTDEKAALGVRVRELGDALSRERERIALSLSARICDELAYLDMPNTRLVFALRRDKVTISGMDTAELLIAANKGEEPKPLSKIASGGELSRIMLAIKSVQADGDNATMIFDEIDAGISGRAAHKVGLKMRELSRGRQVLCVTHLAQIAAMADHHLLIEKATKSDGRTYTAVRHIVGEERKREVARIISGDDDELSLANAERLLCRNGV